MKYIFILFLFLFSKEVIQAQTCTVTISNPTPSVCLGSSAVLTASGATTYSWSTGATTASISVSPTATTVYTVTGIAATCTQVVTTTVTIKSLPSLTISPTSPTVCSGSAITLTVSGASTYTWNTSATTTTIGITPTINTTYTATGTATNGCINTTIKTVTVNNQLTVSPASQTICSGRSTTLTASGSTTYSWSTGATTTSISVSPTVTTTYTVRGTTGSCVKTLSITVTVNSLPTLTISPASPTVCSGSSITLTVSGASTYTWNTSATTTTISITPTINTTYTATGTASNGCTNTAVKTVTVNNQLAVSPASQTICAGSSTTLTASGSTTYSWSTGATTTSIVVTPTTTTTYTVRGTSGSCVKTLSVTITVNALPSTSISASTATICAGNSTTLTASGATTYTWNSGATTSSIAVSPTITTNYTVTGASNGCTKTATSVVTVYGLPNLTISPTSPTVCSGSAITLTVSGASTYTWNTGATTTTISITPTINTTYTATGTSTNGCINTTIKTVTVNNQIVVSPTSQTICAGSSTTLTASGATTYSWSTGATTSSIIVTPTETTTYTVRGTTGSCVKTLSITITVNPIPVVNISNPTPSVCLGGSAILTASGSTTYTWSTGAITASVSVSPTVTTIYSVTSTSLGCSSTATTTVYLGCPLNYNNIGYKTKWTNLYGTLFRRDSLLVNGTPVPDGYPTAISKNTLLANTDGWAEQIIGSPICSNYAMGFCDSAAARNGDYFDIDFAIHVYINSLYLFSNGNISYLGTVTNGDVLRIERIGSNYNLKKNSTILYTAAAPASKNLKLKGVMNVDPIVNIGCSFGDSTGINFPNYVQAKAVTYNSTGLNINDGKIALTPSFGNTGYTYLWATTSETTSSVVDINQGIYQVTIKDTLQNASTYTYSIDYKVNWSVLEGCSFINDSLVPSEPLVGTGWSDAISDNLLLQGSTGEISWTIDNFTGDKVIGLFDIVTADAGSYSDIDDGIYQSGNALYQKSQDVYTLISYCAIGDVIKMAKTGNYINYYRNGNLISTATTINTALDLKIKAAFTVNTPPIKIKTSFVSFNPPVEAYNDSQLNWHQEETFDENGNVIGTQKTYLDNLGRATQDLVKNATNEVFTSQTVYDSYGRPAISTMPAFTGNALAYQSWFMRAPNGQEYNYSHFDTPGTLNAPTLLSTSLYKTLGNYYSNTNPYDAYQAIADNPYTRVEYTGDPGGSQRRVSKPGNAFKMGSGKENYSFSMITGDELKFVFGVATSYKAIQKQTDKMDCTPLATGESFELPVEIIASKQISISPDNVETISYSVGDKLIATCYAGLSAGETCNNLVSVSNKMYYKGTKSVDVHLPNADKNSLYLPLPLQGPTNSTTVTPSNSIVFSITDLYTDTPLFDITDYTIDANRNVIFNSVFLNKYVNKSLFLRISYYYTPAYEAALSISSTVPPADGVLTYNLSYGRFSKNYYDFGGALRKSVSPKGFACNTPTLITMATTYDYDYRGQLIAKKSPDEGLVEMTYDKEGKLRFSQNAEQKINNRFSYVNYDKHARPYESGEYQSVNATGSAWFTNYYLLGPPSNSVGVTSASIIDQQDGLLDAQKTNTTITSYLVPSGSNNIPSAYTYISQYQSFRNGQVNFVKNKNSTIWFNYDKIGRKTSTITQITEADFVAKKPAINDQIKTSESSYNYFTGITNNATYQLNNSSEKLLYQYSYDANYKPIVTNLTYGSTSQNLNSYFYTKMGQLKRTVIGNNLQGMDFVYTLNGGLKAINHPGLDATLDPGADNGDYSGSNPALVNKDLFGEIIEFYNGDYQRNNTNINSSISVGNSKYNNLIYGVRFKTRAQVNATNTGADYIDYSGPSQTQIITGTGYKNQELSFTYNYDEFNQLAKTTFNTYNNSTNALSQRSEYAETGAGGGNIAYDRNGNITRLVRQAYNSVVLDNLTNTIDATTNKLTAIVDAASNSYPQSVNFKTPSQISTSPFVYNSIGQLTQSSAENISAITYMPDGKVQTITFTNGNTTTYEYGAGGEKLKSKFYNPTTNKTKYTWYVGPYIYEFDEAGANTFNIAEVKLGGAVIRVNAATVSTGYLVYQVTDHLGNVRATYKSNGTGNGIDILSYNDYYAFGGQLPGRSYTAENYRFGYQGQEKGDASNPWYQFELRMYNQDIGRWFAPDPYGQFASPYIAMANNPVSCVDPDGGYVSMKQGGEYSREYMKLHQTGMFAPQEMRDRYKREFEDIKARFLNGDVIGQDKRNLDNFYNEMLDLNNRYLGLLKYTGIEIGMQNGTDFMTKNEVHTLKVDGRLAAINDQVGVGHASFGTEFSDNTSMEDASNARKLNLNSRISTSARFALMNKGKGDKDSQGYVVGTKTEVYNGNGSETHYYFNLNGELTAVIEKGANGSLTQTYNNEIFKNEVVNYSGIQNSTGDGSTGTNINTWDPSIDEAISGIGFAIGVNGELLKASYKSVAGGSKIIKGVGIISIATEMITGGVDVYKGYKQDGGKFGYNSKVATGKATGGFAGAIIGAEIGGSIGATVGACFFGVGALPGVLIGGAVGMVGGYFGSEAGGYLGEQAAINYYKK